MEQIRPFHQNDREALRRICVDVAFLGEPIEPLCPDRELTADLLSAYYTDYEPQSSLVAEIDGQVVAYINGCFDNRRYGLAVFFLIIPKLILKGIYRGFFLKPQFVTMFKALCANGRRLLEWRKESFHSHQGHLHIGVSKNFRRAHWGRQLVEILLDKAKKQGVCEITASVHADNTAACRFFEGQGFHLRKRYRMQMAHGDSVREYTSFLYAKTIA